jgi:DNA-binding NarL/FixJ family response regulator
MVTGLSISLVAESNQLVSTGIEALLREHPAIGMVSLVNDAATLQHAMQTAADVNILLICEALLNGDPCDAISAIAQQHPSTFIVVLLDHADRMLALGYLAAGAHGFLDKSCSKAEFHTAVSLVLAGRVYVPPSFSDNTFAEPEIAITMEQIKKPSELQLTARQEQIMQLVATGYSNKEVARKLGIAEATVKVHLGTIFKRFGVHNRTGAVAQIHSSRAA